jgi:hypothetical protein
MLCNTHIGCHDSRSEQAICNARMGAFLYTRTRQPDRETRRAAPWSLPLRSLVAPFPLPLPLPGRSPAHPAPWSHPGRSLLPSESLRRPKSVSQAVPFTSDVKDEKSRKLRPFHAIFAMPQCHKVCQQPGSTLQIIKRPESPANRHFSFRRIRRKKPQIATIRIGKSYHFQHINPCKSATM